VLHEYFIVLACSFASGLRREETRGALRVAIKDLLRTDSFSEFMVCKVEARSMWPRPSYATYCRFPSFLLNPKSKFSKKEGINHWIYPGKYQGHCVTRFAPDKSCFLG